jgi:hypothetical protein
MLASHTDAPAMVGYARTARIAAVAPPTEPPEVIKARRMAYYRALSDKLDGFAVDPYFW